MDIYSGICLRRRQSRSLLAKLFGNMALFGRLLPGLPPFHVFLCKILLKRETEHVRPCITLCRVFCHGVALNTGARVPSAIKSSFFSGSVSVSVRLSLSLPLPQCSRNMADLTRATPYGDLYMGLCVPLIRLGASTFSSTSNAMSSRLLMIT